MSAKKKNKHETENERSRSWEPFAAGVFVVGLVVLIFLVTNRGTDQEGPSTTVPQAPRSATSPSSAALSPEDLAVAERIEVEEARRLIDQGEAITIDVRDVDGYVAGHIPGALQIPLQYVAGEIPWFPRDRLIITYCT